VLEKAIEKGSLGRTPFNSDPSILEATSSGAASSRAHAAVENVSDIQPLSCCCALIKEPLLAPAAGWAESGTDGCIDIEHCGMISVCSRSHVENRSFTWRFWSKQQLAMLEEQQGNIQLARLILRL